jgi:hypothetical protein
MTLLCYTFQTKPSLVKIDNQIDGLIVRLYNLMGEEKHLENSNDIRAILLENVMF